MPLIRGPLWDQQHRPSHVYASVESLMLVYETDPDAIPSLLREPFRRGKSPTVTVMFNDSNGVDAMAGGDYRFAAIIVVVIGLVMGVGGNGLIGVPLVGFAVARFMPRQCLLVYVAVAGGVILPLGWRRRTRSSPGTPPGLKNSL